MSPDVLKPQDCQFIGCAACIEILFSNSVQLEDRSVFISHAEFGGILRVIGSNPKVRYGTMRTHVVVVFAVRGAGPSPRGGWPQRGSNRFRPPAKLVGAPSYVSPGLIRGLARAACPSFEDIGQRVRRTGLIHSATMRAAVVRLILFNVRNGFYI